MKSETKILSGHLHSGLIFIDSPGLKDTAGIAVDIANAIGITNIVVSAKSVRLLLLIDCNSVESGRGEAFRDFITMMSKFLSNIDQFLDSISVFYTKSERGSMNAQRLLNLLAKLYREDHIKSDKQVAAFIKHHVSWLSQHQSKVFVNPLDPDSRQQLLDIIKSSVPIPGSAELFGFPLSRNAQLLLKQQMQGHAPRSGPLSSTQKFQAYSVMLG